MQRRDTDSTNLSTLGAITPCLRAVALVMKHPSSTIGELVTRTQAGLNEQRRDLVRLALLGNLQQAAERGHLANGPGRECRVRGVKTTTWMPGDLLNTPVLPPPGLRGLASRLLAAVEAAQG